MRGSSAGGPSSPLPERSFRGRGAGPGVGAQVNPRGGAEGATANSPPELTAPPGQEGGKEGGSEGREGSRAAPKRGRKGPRRRARGAARSGGVVPADAPPPALRCAPPGPARRCSPPRARLSHRFLGSRPRGDEPRGSFDSGRDSPPRPSPRSWSPPLRLPPLFLLSTRHILRGKNSNAAGRGGECNEVVMIQA